MSASGFLPALVIGAAACTWTLAFATSAREPRLAEHQVAHRPIQLPSDGYVSSGTCQACHPREYATWHASYHRTMTQVATPATVMADFGGVTIADVHGRPMRLDRTDRRFWAEFDDPDWDGAGQAAPRIRREVVMITGSHHQQIYWYATGQNRLLGQLPGAYLIAERRWIPRRMAVLHPPSDPVFSETGHWNSTCIACHATNGKPQFDTPFGSAPIQRQVVETTAVEFGIACEACHGPAADHVRANRNPFRRYGLHFRAGGDGTIVQPASLAARSSSQACGQCHGIWEFYDADGERYANSRGLPYRPGGELLDTRFVARPTVNRESPTMKALLAADEGFLRDSFWADGMVRVSGREYNGLVESPCFEDAKDDRRRLSCFSCHTMHQAADDPRPVREWADDQLTLLETGAASGIGTSNEACLQCHGSYRDGVSAHTRHAADSTGSTCYNCHMPYTTYGLLKTIRSHTVSSPSVAESSETGRPNACNLCHLDQTLAWTAAALARWYDTPPVPLEPDETRIAASLLWALRGDAGQRAIVAQAMGWTAAQQTSGTAWMAPYLAELLNDPYDAVRFIAARSLRTLPAFSTLAYDFIAPPSSRYQAQLRTMRIWDGLRQERPREARLLIFPDGSLDVQAVLRLLKARDHRRVLLRE